MNRLLPLAAFASMLWTGCGRGESQDLPAKGGITINSMKWSVNLFNDEMQIITRAKYEKIKPGMSFDELAAVLGLPLDRWRPDLSHVAADAPVELRWEAGFDQKKERSITVNLRGQTVISCSQTGLE
jgi:hypothetical protein